MKVSLVNVNLVAQDAVGHSLLNQLRFFQKRGDDVCVYTMSPPQAVPDSVTRLTRVVNLADLIAGRQLHFACSDLYVFHYPGHYPFIETIKGIDWGAVILYYHNVTPPELWTSKEDRPFLRRSQIRVGELLPYVDLIVTPSEFNADHLVRDYKCERSRIRVLPLAVPLDYFKPGQRDPLLLQRYNLMDRRVILFVGRMAGNKRIDLLVEALPLIRQQVSDVALLLVGDDRSNQAFVEYVARVKARAEELGVADCVIFTGRVDDLPSYYRLASVYATASLHEGFDVPVIEAMACGVPVVASRAAAHLEVIGDAGLLSEPGSPSDIAEKIVQVLTDEKLHTELAQRGLKRALEFSLENYEAGWAGIIDEVMEWLSAQPYPRSRSVLAQPVWPDLKDREYKTQRIHDILMQGEFARLEHQADVVLRSYVVRSRLPILGSLITWLRRNLTSHLREPYIDPMFERQVTFNRELIKLLARFCSQHNGKNRVVTD